MKNAIISQMLLQVILLSPSDPYRSLIDRTNKLDGLGCLNMFSFSVECSTGQQPKKNLKLLMKWQ